jgi:recombination protein RecT
MSKLEQGLQRRENKQQTFSMVLKDKLAIQESQFQIALGDSKKAKMLARSVITAVMLDPKLHKCSIDSIIKSAQYCAEVGLRPGIGGKCFLIPYGNQCTAQLGYQGLKSLFYRSKIAKGLDFGALYPDDIYQIEKGLNPKFSIIPAELKGDEKPIAYWAIAYLTTGASIFHVMYVSEVISHRNKSPQAKANKLWDRDPKAFGYKTVMLQLFKRVDLEYDILEAIEQDGGSEALPLTPNGDPVSIEKEETNTEEPDFTVEDVAIEPTPQGEELGYLELLDVARGLLLDSDLKPAVTAKFESRLKMLDKDGKPEDVKLLIKEIQETK